MKKVTKKKLNKNKTKQKNKTRKIGRSTIYYGPVDMIEDQIKKTDDTYDGKPYFRKLYPKNKTRKIGGSTIYYGPADMIEDQIKKTDDTYDGKPYFRKVYRKIKKSDDTRDIEKQIVEILMNNPHKNIVTFYDVNDRYLDMEELDSPHSNPEFYDNFKDETPIIKEVMIEVKDFLQNLGIMYIDWKFDNIAKGKDGNYKLFDFDASGIVDLYTNRWKVKPPKYWSFGTAKKRHCKTPKEIDDWSFRYNILEEEDFVCPTKGV